jgi:shikimate kinase
MDSNIVLVGFMGTGKTVVAKALAQDLGMRYVSVDDLIEKREKITIKDIFEKQGEQYFRKLEKEIVLEVSGMRGRVVDPGGGIVLDEENMRNLKNSGIVICLWAEPETIHERTRLNAHRPLLNVKDPLGRIKEMLETRRPFYNGADLHVQTDGLDVKQVVEKIKRIVDGTPDQK